MPRAAQLLITGVAAVAGAWLLLWPVIAGTLSRQSDDAGHDRDEQQEQPVEERSSGLEHRDDRA